jgi:hypothetical protein
MVRSAADNSPKRSGGLDGLTRKSEDIEEYKTQPAQKGETAQYDGDDADDQTYLPETAAICIGAEIVDHTYGKPYQRHNK